MLGANITPDSGQIAALIYTLKALIVHGVQMRLCLQCDLLRINTSAYMADLPKCSAIHTTIADAQVKWQKYSYSSFLI